MRSRVGFVSLGCPKNLVDTERMIGLLSAEGATIVANDSDAEFVVINTCGFLESAKNESLDTIREYAGKRSSGGLRGLIVTGCMTERYLTLMNSRFPEVDAFLQTKEFSKIVEVVSAISNGDHALLEKRRALVGDSEQLAGHSEMEDFVKRNPGKRSFAYVKISEGCNRRCSFCIIPKLRGLHHSRSVAGIVDEVKQLVNFGVREVVFIAQDLTSYGRDRADGASLLTLLREVEAIDGLQWMRLMYNYPRFFTDELISFLAQSKKFTGYLDIPFQHLSDSILKGMRRPETAAEIDALIVKLRKAIPHLSLRTTVMVGFPGETNEDFEVLLEGVRRYRFNHLGAFTYFREEGTDSYHLPNQVDEATKQARYAKLMKTQKKAQNDSLKSLVGKTLPVLIDGVGERAKEGYLHLGRHAGQAPEIDGITYVLAEELLAPGTMVEVEIAKVFGDYDLLGTPEVNVRDFDRKIEGL